MLVLSRSQNQKIIIGSGENIISVSILEVRGNQVKIGIEAPKEIPVHRQEIFEKIAAQ